ncbi:unnamed protein product [Thelazia callipaeda]|uniref:Uncharacterized protein n=1 Tax=Thelazia callipaeda TaxID=103827 RepID=A0A0N5D4A1_THECL|nr:unnamed protein product [Thelazia callipaeda]
MTMDKEIKEVEEESSIDSSSSSDSNDDEHSYENGSTEEMEESDLSSDESSESPRSRLIKSVTSVKENIVRVTKPLEKWHQYILNSVLYNKEFVYVDKVFCWIQQKSRLKREQVRRRTNHSYI